MVELYFNREELIAAAKEATRTNRNRQFNDNWIDLVAADTKYFTVVIAFPHNDVEMRVEIMMDSDGGTAWLDIPFQTFEALGRTDDLVKAQKAQQEVR